MKNKTVVCIALSIFLSSCNTPVKESQKSSSELEEKNLHCSVSDHITGREHLDQKYLQEALAIETDPKKSKSNKDMVLIKGGVFEMGGDRPSGFENMPSTALAQNDEFPKHKVQVSNFYMDSHEVTVGEYLEFVDATGYKTVAEQDIDWEELKKQLPPDTPKPSEEKLKAGAMVFHYVPKGTSKDNLANWWEFVAGVNWKNPDNTHPEIQKILNYPVTQISWYDAVAYAKWVGKRLPTEAEFEYAMRAGKNNEMYPWGNEKLKTGVYKGNFLQGSFPYENTGADGYVGLAPIKQFPPNAYGLYDISGNVWEWTQDWYSAKYYYELQQAGATAINPKGPDSSFEVLDNNSLNKSVKGGSFLCNDDWCSGYRNSRRMRLTPDSGMQHLGFRLVRDAK